MYYYTKVINTYAFLLMGGSFIKSTLYSAKQQAGGVLVSRVIGYVGSLTAFHNSLLNVAK